ncbi:MAG: hypothetical protein JWL88_800 [Parcubacteria group bacterium]|nr:hypothetical protein [Parcubacteria group bacterium]
MISHAAQSLAHYFHGTCTPGDGLSVIFIGVVIPWLAVYAGSRLIKRLR